MKSASDSSTAWSPIPWRAVWLPWLFLVPFLYAMWFAYPFGDDFARANTAWVFFYLPKALMKAVEAWFSWSGRYSHHFLVVFFGKMAVYRATYALMCLAILLLNQAALYGIYRQMTGRPKSECAFYAVLTSLVLYSGYKALHVTYYNLTDILGLGLANTLSLIFIWRLLEVWNADHLGRKSRWLCLGVGIFTVGCYEYSAIAAVLFSGAALALAYWGDHRHKRFFLKTFIIVCLCLFASFLAPGNFARQTERAVTPDVMAGQLADAFPAWVDHALLGFNWFYAMALAGLSLCLRPSMRWQGKRPLPLPLLLAGTGVLFAMLTGGVILLSALGDQPIVAGANPKLTSSLTVLGAYVLAFGLFAVMGPVRRLVPSPLRTALLLSLLAWIPFTGTYAHVVADAVSGKMAAYAASMEARKEFLGSQEGKNVRVARLPVYPFPSGGEPIPANPTDWPGTAIAEMFKLDTVQSERPDPNAAAEHAVDSPTTVVPGLGKISLVRGVPGIPNKTFARTWLRIDGAQNPPEQFQSLVVLNENSGSLLPGWVLKALRDPLLNQGALKNDWYIPFLGVTNRFQGNAYRVGNPGSEEWMLPVATPDWLPVRAIYVMGQDGLWHKIQL